jgi:SAM-dependent methyltransferase
VRLSPSLEAASAWHDVECASYAADLPLWRELAAGADGPVLDVGAGTGRVALDLAARGTEVTALDADAELVRACAERARERSVPVRTVAADCRSFELGTRFGLAILPMQVAQLLGGARGRAAMLAAVRAHLHPGATLAVAVADPFGDLPATDALPPLPDLLERDGWVLSSTPVEVREESDATVIVRHRQAVSPAGELSEELATTVLERVPPGALEQEMHRAGLEVLPRRAVPPTPDYVGAVVVCARAAP